MAELKKGLLDAQSKLIDLYYGHIQCDTCKYDDGTDKCTKWKGKKPTEILSHASICGKYEKA